MADTIEAVGLIRAPVESVFQYVTDLANLPHWVGPIKALDGGDDSASVGTEVSVRAHLIGKDVETSLKVTDVQENKKFAYEFDQDLYAGGFEFSFETAFDNYTKVLMSFRMAEGHVFRGQEPAITRNLHSSLESLKENIEGGSS